MEGWRGAAACSVYEADQGRATTAAGQKSAPFQNVPTADIRFQFQEGKHEQNMK